MTTTQQTELAAAARALLEEAEYLVPMGDRGKAMRRLRAVLAEIDAQPVDIPTHLKHPGGTLPPVARREPLDPVKSRSYFVDVDGDEDGAELGAAGFQWVTLRNAPCGRLGATSRRRTASQRTVPRLQVAGGLREFLWAALILAAVLLGSTLAPR